jgi:hypothetical protein
MEAIINFAFFMLILMPKPLLVSDIRFVKRCSGGCVGRNFSGARGHAPRFSGEQANTPAM